jgi:hypothetical protein
MTSLRSTITKADEPRAIPFRANAPCFYVYRIVDGRTYPLVVDCNSLSDAVDGGKVQCIHKDHLLIREVAGERDILHLYAIKRKSHPRYVYRNYAYDRVHDLYAAHVCTIDARMLNQIQGAGGLAEQAPRSVSR